MQYFKCFNGHGNCIVIMYTVKLQVFRFKSGSMTRFLMTYLYLAIFVLLKKKHKSRSSE